MKIIWSCGSEMWAMAERDKKRLAAETDAYGDHINIELPIYGKIW